MKVFIAGKDFSQYFVGLPMREVGDTIQGHAVDCGIMLDEIVITVEGHDPKSKLTDDLDGYGLGAHVPDVGN